MKMQVCPGCLAHIDVSRFAAGERVSCGGCNNVLVVQGTEAVARPTLPRTPKRGRSHPAHGGRDRGRGRRPLRRRSTGNPALLYGSLAAVLLVVVVAIVAWPRGGNGDSPSSFEEGASSNPMPGPKKEGGWVWVLKNFEKQYAATPPRTKMQFHAAIDRLERIGAPAREVLTRVYTDYVAGPGADSERAHRFLGHAAFVKEVPESIAFREYPYLRAVEEAAAKHWFAPNEKDQLDAANRAWKLVEEHAHKLETDRKFRAIDQIRANVSRDPFLRNYKFAVRWAEPYLICYSSHHRLSEFDLLSITDADDRRQLREEIEQRQRSFDRILDEKAVLFTSVYQEYMRRYRDRFGLKDLMAEWGGRPDYGVGERSFKDGCPLVVWIFSDHKAFVEYHAKVKREEISPYLAGYFSPRSGYIFLFDKATDRLGEINKNVHEATHQLQHWFTRQRRGWRPPSFVQNFIGEGFAEWFGSVRMASDHKLTFVGVNVPRVRAMQAKRLQFEAAEREYPIFPLEQLVSFSTYADVARWGIVKWRLPPVQVLLLFYEQSWALVRFLHDGANGRRRDKLLDFLDVVLADRPGWSDEGSAFKRLFGLKQKRAWDSLDQEFEAYIRGTLMRMDVERFAYEPPPLGGRR